MKEKRRGLSFVGLFLVTLVSLIFLILSSNFALAYNGFGYSGYGSSFLGQFIENELVFFLFMFVIFFAVIFYPLTQVFRENRVIPAIIAAALGFFISVSIQRELWFFQGEITRLMPYFGIILLVFFLVARIYKRTENLGLSIFILSSMMLVLFYLVYFMLPYSGFFNFIEQYVEIKHLLIIALIISVISGIAALAGRSGKKLRERFYYH